jgi:hypothetical protein
MSTPRPLTLSRVRPQIRTRFGSVGLLEEGGLVWMI